MFYLEQYQMFVKNLFTKRNEHQHQNKIVCKFVIIKFNLSGEIIERNFHEMETKFLKSLQGNACESHFNR